jgi:hypothetical protein
MSCRRGGGIVAAGEHTYPDAGGVLSGRRNRHRGGRPGIALELSAGAGLAPNNVDYHTAVARILLIMSDTQYGDTRGKRGTGLTPPTGPSADPESPKGYAIKAMALDWNGEQRKPRFSPNAR